MHKGGTRRHIWTAFYTHIFERPVTACIHIDITNTLPSPYGSGEFREWWRIGNDSFSRSAPNHQFTRNHRQIKINAENPLPVLEAGELCTSTLSWHACQPPKMNPVALIDGLSYVRKTY